MPASAPAEVPSATRVVVGAAVLSPSFHIPANTSQIPSEPLEKFNPRSPQSRRQTRLRCDGHQWGGPKSYRNQRSSDRTLPPSAPPLPSLSTASPTNTRRALRGRGTPAWWQRGSPAGDGQSLRTRTSGGSPGQGCSSPSRQLLVRNVALWLAGALCSCFSLL